MRRQPQHRGAQLAGPASPSAQCTRSTLAADSTNKRVRGTKTLTAHSRFVLPSTGGLGDSVGPRRPARRLLRTERADPVVLTKQCQSQTKREPRRSCVAIPEPRHSPLSPPLPLSGPADRTTARFAEPILCLLH